MRGLLVGTLLVLGSRGRRNPDRLLEAGAVASIGSVGDSYDCDL